MRSRFILSSQLLPLLITLVLSFFTIQPLLHTGLFPMHDNTQVARVYEMGKALKDGMFPVRWVSDLGYGYGYPIFTFYAPFAYYLGGILVLLGANALLATKLMMGIGMLLAGITMYLCASQFWGKSGGIVTAVLYLYAPYHAVDLYVRGDVAELFAYAFIPLAFYGVWKIYTTASWRAVIVAAIGYGGIICSHNLTALLVTPFLSVAVLILLIIAWRRKALRTVYFLIAGFVFSILVSSFYWLPALSEMQYTNVISQIGGGADFRDHFVCLSQLWNSPWGYGGSAPGCVDGLSFRIGKLHLLLAFITIISSFFLYKRSKQLFFVWFYGLIGCLISVFFTLEISRFIWEGIKPMAFLQYPWRFLLLTSFFISFITGSLFRIIPLFFPKKNIVVILTVLMGVLLIAGILGLNEKLFVPQIYLGLSNNDYTNTTAVRFDASTLTDEYLPKGFKKPKTRQDLFVQKFILTPATGKIVVKQEKTQEYTLAVITDSQSVLHANLAYFPAWQYTIDGKAITPKIDSTGVDILIPKGNHSITFSFQQTLVEKLSDLLSLAGILGLLVGIIV